MRARFAVLGLWVLAACPQPDTDGAIAPDLARALEDLAAGERAPVLVLGRDGHDPFARVRDAGLEGRAFRHVPVSQVWLTAAEARRLAARGGVFLAADRPLVASGKSVDEDDSSSAKKATKASSGTAYTGDRDLIRRSVGADLVHDGTAGVTADGDGVVIAIIDSGVRETHPDFPADFVVAAGDFVEDDGHGVEPGDATKDPYGHGTMVAGVIVGGRDGAEGVAPGARLVVARVLDDDGAGTTSAAIAALDWILEEADETGVRVVHFSVGAAPAGSFTEDPLAVAVESALDAGLVVVAAAGNFGASDGETVYGGIVSPATHPGVITVGAVDPAGTARRSDDTLATFTSRGPTLFDGLGKPDVVAPGASLPLLARSGGTLWTSWPSSHVASWSGVTLDDAPYAVASGTSFAAPIVTGTVALMLETAPDLDAVQTKAILELTAADVGDSTLLGSGAGLVNTAGAVRLAAAWGEALAGGSPATPTTSDTIEGETVTWSMRLLWDGFVVGEDDLSHWNADGVLAVGDLDGTGILWDGWEADLRRVRYVGAILEGSALLEPSWTLALSGDLWGTGILWDGEWTLKSGRVWAAPATWSERLVWPAHLEAAGAMSPLFEAPALTGLTEPVDAAADPTPPEPDFTP